MNLPTALTPKKKNRKNFSLKNTAIKFSICHVFLHFLQHLRVRSLLGIFSSYHNPKKQWYQRFWKGDIMQIWNSFSSPHKKILDKLLCLSIIDGCPFCGWSMSITAYSSMRCYLKEKLCVFVFFKSWEVFFLYILRYFTEEL